MARSSNFNAGQQTQSRVCQRQPYTMSNRNAVAKFISTPAKLLPKLALVLSFATFNVHGLKPTTVPSKVPYVADPSCGLVFAWCLILAL